MSCPCKKAVNIFESAVVKEDAMRTKEVKHITGDGVETIFTRLYADDGKALTNDNKSFWNCIDVLPDEVNDWREVDAPEQEDEPNV